MTGDLRIITNDHLRKLISKGPNYREPRSINWKKCKEAITDGLNMHVDKMRAKFDLSKDDLTPWIEEVLKQVGSKLALLKRKVKFNKVKPVLQRPDVAEYLDQLQSKFVLAPIDKAANNISIICKRFYVEVILKEIGILDVGNSTYVKSDSSKDEVIRKVLNMHRL